MVCDDVAYYMYPILGCFIQLPICFEIQKVANLAEISEAGSITVE